MRKYNLEGSMSDRMNFDDVQRQYAFAMLQALHEEEALVQDPMEFAGIGWEAFLIDMEVGAVEVEDLEEAQARFFCAFQAAVIEWQRERMIDLFNDVYHSQGETLTLVAVPAEEYGGNWDNGRWIEIVVLDETSISFRECSNAHDGDWVLSDIDAAVDTVFEVREAVVTQNEEHQEMLEQQEIINQELEGALVNA